MRYFDSFDQAITEAQFDLLDYGQEVDTGHWQGVATEGKPDLTTVELVNYSFVCLIPTAPKQGFNASGSMDLIELRRQIQPNLPWADDHFEERISRVPNNPGVEYKNWPWWRGQDAAATRGSRVEGQFTHTYQERFWPKRANRTPEQGGGPYYCRDNYDNHGIRYKYGDLDDIVALLLREPYTRQAYLPIFFPEDTGAVHGGRIPCTLGYHFMLRNGQLHMWYTIRSCDYIRHFRDDIYLACRLLLWVIEECRRKDNVPGESLWDIVRPGYLHMTCFSLHYHKGDEHLVREG